MGVVYRATHPRLGSVVAIKAMDLRLSRDESQREPDGKAEVLVRAAGARERGIGQVDFHQSEQYRSEVRANQAGAQGKRIRRPKGA